MVSVIIPTYNGASKLPNLLKALGGQTFKEFEVLIVVDGSTDNTVSFLQNFTHNLNLEVFVQENQGRACVRNRGAAKAKGELLVFFDDDMVPLPDCLHQHINHHLIHPNSLLSGAQIDDLSKAHTSFQKYKCFLSTKWANPIRQLEGHPLPLEQMHLTAANFSISKKAFQTLGGFDEQLKDNEDLDLAIRAFQKGYVIYYKHSAFAWHNDFPSCKSFIKRQIEYAHYHEYVRINKKEVYAEVHRFSQSPEKLSLVKRKFYSLWKYNWWVMLADKDFFAALPKKLQFKIYDWIVFAHVHLK